MARQREHAGPRPRLPTASAAPWEGDEEGIPLVVDFIAATGAEKARPQDVAMAGERLSVALSSEGLERAASSPRCP